MTDDHTDPCRIVLATLRDHELHAHYVSEQGDLQPHLRDLLRDALGAEFDVQISVGAEDVPKPRVSLFGKTFWPDIVVSRGGVPIVAIEVKLIRERERPTAPIAETIGQAVIYRLHYPRAMAFILQEGATHAEAQGPEADLCGLLARCGVDLVRRCR